MTNIKGHHKHHHHQRAQNFEKPCSSRLSPIFKGASVSQIRCPCLFQVQRVRLAVQSCETQPFFAILRPGFPGQKCTLKQKRRSTRLLRDLIVARLEDRRELVKWIPWNHPKCCYSQKDRQKAALWKRCSLKSSWSIATTKIGISWHCSVSPFRFWQTAIAKN